MSEPVKILIVDDQPRARQSLRALLATWPLVGTLREANHGADAIESVTQAQPDLVLMDVLMPVMNGLEATRQIKACWPQVKIIVLSLYGDYQAEALAAGADAFVSKGVPPDKLLETISIVAAESRRKD